LYLLQMLVTGRWILDEPESKIKDHTSSIKNPGTSIQSFLVPACPS